MPLRRLRRRNSSPESSSSSCSSSVSTSSCSSECDDASASSDEHIASVVHPDLKRRVDDTEHIPRTAAQLSSAATLKVVADLWLTESREREKLEYMERIIAKRLMHLTLQFAAFSAVAKRNLLGAQEDAVPIIAQGAPSLNLDADVKEQDPQYNAEHELSPPFPKKSKAVARVVVSPPQESCGVSEDDKDDANPCEPLPTPPVQRQHFLSQGYRNSTAGPEEQAAESRASSVHRTWCEMSCAQSAPPVEIPGPTPPLRSRLDRSAIRTPSNSSAERLRRPRGTRSAAAPMSPAALPPQNIYSFASIVTTDSTPKVATARGSRTTSRPVSPSVAESPLYVARRLRRQFLSSQETESNEPLASTAPKDYFSAVKAPETAAAKRLQIEQEKLDTEERVYEERLRALEKSDGRGVPSAEFLAVVAALDHEESCLRAEIGVGESAQRLVGFVQWMQGLRSIVSASQNVVGTSLPSFQHSSTAVCLRSMQDEKSMLSFLTAPQRFPTDAAAMEEFRRECLCEEEHVWRLILVEAAERVSRRSVELTDPAIQSPLHPTALVAKLSALRGQSVGDRQNGHQATWETNFGFDKVLTMNRMIKDSVLPFLSGSTEPRKSIRMSTSDEKPFSFSHRSIAPCASHAPPSQPHPLNSSAIRASPFSTMTTQFGTTAPIASTVQPRPALNVCSASAVDKLPYLNLCSSSFQLCSSSAGAMPSTARRILDNTAPHLAGSHLERR